MVVSAESTSLITEVLVTKHLLTYSEKEYLVTFLFYFWHLSANQSECLKYMTSLDAKK